MHSISCFHTIRAYFSWFSSKSMHLFIYNQFQLSLLISSWIHIISSFKSDCITIFSKIHSSTNSSCVYFIFILAGILVDSFQLWFHITIFSWFSSKLGWLITIFSLHHNSWVYIRFHIHGSRFMLQLWVWCSRGSRSEPHFSITVQFQAWIHFSWIYQPFLTSVHYYQTILKVSCIIFKIFLHFSTFIFNHHSAFSLNSWILIFSQPNFLDLCILS